MARPTPRMQNASRGKLTTWKPDRTFGFIRPDDGSADVFVHLRDFGQISRAPRVGDVIRYQRVSDGKGRYRAADVQVEGLQRAAGTAPSRGMPPRRKRGTRTEGASRGAALLAGLFLAGVVLLAAAGPLSWIVPPLYVIASLAAWLMYALNCAALAWACTPAGAQAIRSLVY